jgi:hypothetical protein
MHLSHLNVNLKVVTTESGFLHSQPFTNSHSHFLIIVESVTPPQCFFSSQNVSLMGQGQDCSVNGPDVTSHKLKQLLCLTMLCAVAMLYLRIAHATGALGD